MSIWNHREIRKSLEAEVHPTLGEGYTELSRLSDSIFLKREDLNPTCSWKDRGSAYKAAQFIKEGLKGGVLTTSGNAGISLATYLKEFIPEFKLTLIVSNSVNQNKLSILQKLCSETGFSLIISDNPRKEASEISARLELPNLKSSTDDEILKGYWSLGFELAEEVVKNQVDTIFIPVSSGTAFVGIAQGLFMRVSNEQKMPKLVGVQTDSVSPIADSFLKDNFVPSSERNLADAIIDKTALRAPQVIKAINETGGTVVRVSNSELEKIKNETEINLSYTSLLTLAASKSYTEYTKAICITSGL